MDAKTVKINVPHTIKDDDPKEVDLSKLPCVVIIFHNPANPLEFRSEFLNGVTQHQILWAVHWTYQQIMTHLQIGWETEFRRQQNNLANVFKFGGSKKKKNKH